MKNRPALLLVTMLLCSLTACGGQQPADTTTTTTTASTTSTTTASSIDYTAFCGHYSDTTTVEGPCYTVSILRVDNATKEIELSISFVGNNSSPVYTTKSIRATIASDHTVQFNWTDSWQNEGVGTLVLNPADSSTVQLMMTVTKEAEVNRATLSTHDEYKILTRR